MLTPVLFHLSATELQTHFGPASECEGAEKEDEVDEEEAEFSPVLPQPADDTVVTCEPTHSAVSTLNSSHSHEPQRSQNHLGGQLGRLKQETNRYACMPSGPKLSQGSCGKIPRHAFAESFPLVTEAGSRKQGQNVNSQAQQHTQSRVE